MSHFEVHITCWFLCETIASSPLRDETVGEYCITAHHNSITLLNNGMLSILNVGSRFLLKGVQLLKGGGGCLPFCDGGDYVTKLEESAKLRGPAACPPPPRKIFEIFDCKWCILNQFRPPAMPSPQEY